MSISIELQIKDYFYSDPKDRLACYKALASHITTVDSVILILDWGADSTRMIEDAWDAAVDLLSEVDDVLTQVIHSKELTKWKSGGFRLEVRMQRLITILAEALAVAIKIHPYKRLVAILDCFYELNNYSSYEHAKNKAVIVAAIIRAIEVSDLNSFKDFLVIPLAIEAEAEKRIDALRQLITTDRP